MSHCGLQNDIFWIGFGVVLKSSNNSVCSEGVIFGFYCTFRLFRFYLYCLLNIVVEFGKQGKRTVSVGIVVAAIRISMTRIFKVIFKTIDHVLDW